MGTWAHLLYPRVLVTLYGGFSNIVPQKKFIQKIAKNTQFLSVHKNCSSHPINFIFGGNTEPYVPNLHPEM